MNKFVIITAFCAAAAFALAPEFAAAQDVVINLASKQIRLALSPVKGDANDKLRKEHFDVLEHALKITALFESVPQSAFLPNLSSETLSSTDYDSWFASGAEALIKSEIDKNGNFKAELYDLTARKTVPLRYDRHVRGTKAQIYEFVNAVVLYYTGQKGFLGQQILATFKSSRNGNTQVVRMQIDGTELSMLSKNNVISLLPSWGPGGSVLYSSYLKNNLDLYRKSDNLVRLSKEDGMNTGAKYCSGSNKIALTLSKDGNAEIYVMDADGGNKIRLTQNSSIDTSPSWSPDCRKIAFVSDRGGSPQIYTMNADGSAQKLLTSAGNYNTSPSWAPKGDLIAFDGRDDRKNFDIFTIKSDGSDLSRVTQDQGQNYSPSWSPDGRYLIFVSSRDGGRKLFISDASGRYQYAISKSSGFDTPVWSR